MMSGGVLSARRRSAAAPGFDPLSIPWHAAFWASDSSWANPGEGGAVSSWRDGSGNGRHATQATAAKQPTYTASHTAFNNRPAVVFDGVDDWLDTATWTALGGVVTHVVVGRANNLSTNSALFHRAVSGSPNRQGLLILSTNQYRIFSGVAVDGGTATTTARMFQARFEEAANDRLLIDGTLIMTGNAGAELCDSIRLGCNNGGTNFLAGGIAFHGTINRLLTATEESDLLSWSRTFYATP